MFFWNSLAFSMIQRMLAIWSLIPLPFLKTAWTSGSLIRVLARELTGHSKHPLPTTQEKTLHMDITRWSTSKSDWLYYLHPKMEKLYTVRKNKTGSWLCLHHKLLFAKFRLELKKVGKTSRPFSYDLNQTPYNYTVEVTNRFKRLDLIDREPEDLWTEFCSIMQ